jgi:hypothetical protein
MNRDREREKEKETETYSADDVLFFLVRGFETGLNLFVHVLAVLLCTGCQSENTAQ